MMNRKGSRGRAMSGLLVLGLFLFSYPQPEVGWAAEQKETFRTTIRKVYGQKILTEPNYDFMDNQPLVKAVTDVRLKSDIAGAGSLVGALANRTNEENQQLYDRMINTMLKKLGYCRTCAERTIEYFCTPVDES